MKLLVSHTAYPHHEGERREISDQLRANSIQFFWKQFLQQNNYGKTKKR